jgi:hypothetical protein
MSVPQGRSASNLRRHQQRGSALLIVFVFAAMIAIALYREMPVAAFEAQRQKEELLMDRGNEYKRAIKLYVRKFQTFPPSMDALEHTNRMRFLRSRYVDPYSGKDDWRLLHAGPGGMIIDSKIKQKPGANGVPGAPGANTAGVGNPFGASSSSSSFGGFSNGSNDAMALLNNGQPANSNQFPQRPPAIALNGGNVGGADIMPGMPGAANALQEADPGDLQQTPTPGMPNAATVPYPGYPGPPTGPTPTPTDSNSQAAQAPYPGYAGPQVGSTLPPANSGSNPNFVPGQQGNNMVATASGAAYPGGRPGRFRNSNPNGDSYSQYGGIPPAGAQNVQDMMQSALANQNPVPNQQNGGFSPPNVGNTSTSSFGAVPTAPTGGGLGSFGSGNNTMGGGIAGVASKAKGHTIKILNDQTDRSLWEFVYDMRQEALANAPGLGTAGPNNPNPRGSNPLGNLPRR